jgi:antitoxin PrlF
MIDEPGSKIAERLVTRPDGATMDEVIAATGGPQYNVLRRLEGRGYRIRKVKEGRNTRYFADAPAAPSCEAAITSKGQLTVPKEIRERLNLHAGARVRFSVEDGRVVLTRAGTKLADLFGILGKPPRSATLEEMDQAIRDAAIARYLRAGGRKR